MTTEPTPTPTPLPDDVPALPTGVVEGRAAFQQCVRDALARAAHEGWRELILCDASFEDWPLGERSVVESLHAWARRGERLVLLAKRYDEVRRDHPRFVDWRRLWSHKLDCRACPQADPLDLPSALWSPTWVLERLDLVRSRGVCGAEPQRSQLLRERLDGWLGRSVPSFPATTLGL